MTTAKKLLKNIAVFFAVLTVGCGAVYGIMLYMFNNAYHTDFALDDDTFTDNRSDFAYAAEYAYGLYKNEIKERHDLRRVTIFLTEITYEYSDGEKCTEKITDAAFSESFSQVQRVFPLPPGEGAVVIVAEADSVRFIGQGYSLCYSPSGRRPSAKEGYKLKRVELFSNKWYHNYKKYGI